MNEKQCLEISLPAHLEDLPIRIIRGSGCKELVCSIPSSESESNIEYSTGTDKKYVFIWQRNDYLKLTLDEILWIEAEDGSYSKIYLTNNRSMVVSISLAVIEKDLPYSDFIRIHRSYLINLHHVNSLIGNTFNIEGKLLTIGSKYRESVFNRFIFIGVRIKDK